MDPLTFLYVVVLGASLAPGTEGYETLNLYAETGSSVFFLDVKSDNYSVFELKRNTSFLLIYHNVWKTRTERGQHFPGNDSFLLRNLTVEDSGTYEYRINMTIVKRKVDLRVIDPLPEPVLVIEGVKGDGSQCLVNITCRAESASPVNVMIQRNKEIIDNVTVTGGSHSLSLDAWNTSGSVTCIVQNEIAFKTSSPTELPLPVTLYEVTVVLVVIAVLIQWLFALPFMLLYNSSMTQCYRLKTWWQRRRQHSACNTDDEERQDFGCDSGKPNIFCRAVCLADDGFGFLKEIFALCISINGGFVPQWCSYLAAALLLCRTAFWILGLLNCFTRKRLRFSSNIQTYCSWAMTFSSLLGVPAFCVIVLVNFKRWGSSPCGMILWFSPLPVFVSVCALLTYIGFLFLSYIWIKCNVKREEEEEQSKEKENQPEAMKLFQMNVPNGGAEQPEDNNNADCGGQDPGVAVGISNTNEESPEQETSNENMAEADPDNMSTEPGQAEVTRRRVRAPPTMTHQDSDGTKEGDGQCIQTVEDEEVALDRDEVANG